MRIFGRASPRAQSDLMNTKLQRLPSGGRRVDHPERRRSYYSTANQVRSCNDVAGWRSRRAMRSRMQHRSKAFNADGDPNIVAGRSI
mmetsp:Transcript_91173/g.190674  ORF Transcript_91173/g.190674 Transcript_91173/m.190674 type:complete len:87 (-) Transcript_91173:171-431(-)